MQSGVSTFIKKTAFKWLAGLAFSVIFPQFSGWAAPLDIDLDKIQDGALHFKTSTGAETPKPLKIDLYDLIPLGRLKPSDGGLPYFVLTGRPCQNCIQDKAVYLIRPMPGKPNTFVYPGKIFDAKTRALVLESRAFFGRCLAGRGDVFVAFQKEQIPRRRGLQSSVMIAEAQGDHLEENLLERRLPSINHTLRAVKRKECQEIEGRNRVMVSRPSLLLPSKRTDSRGEDDDDDSPKENQTDKELQPAPSE